MRDSTFKKTVKEDYEEVFDELELPKFTKYLAENADIANLKIFRKRQQEQDMLLFLRIVCG